MDLVKIGYVCIVVASYCMVSVSVIAMEKHDLESFMKMIGAWVAFCTYLLVSQYMKGCGDMKIQIRRGVFETNSSSMNSVVREEFAQNSTTSLDCRIPFKNMSVDEMFSTIRR